MKKNKAAANVTSLGKANTEKVMDPSIQTTGQCGLSEPGPPIGERGPDGEQHSLEKHRPPVKVADESEVEEVKSCSSLSNSESLTDVSPLFRVPLCIADCTHKGGWLEGHMTPFIVGHMTPFT